MKSHLQVHNSDQVIDRIGDGSCDVGFVEAPSVPRTLNSMTVARDRPVVVAHPTPPWARRRTP